MEEDRQAQVCKGRLSSCSCQGNSAPCWKAKGERTRTRGQGKEELEPTLNLKGILVANSH